MRSLLTLLLLASAGSMAGGCASAGLALVGPLGGSLTAIADRSVERTLPADLDTTWGATVDALARMAVRVEQADRSGPKWRLTGTDEAVTVHGTLERVTAGMTRVSVRVEGGGLFADKKTGDELLNQIAASLATLASAGRPGGAYSVEQLRLLQREIERLSSRIEQARQTSSPGVRADPVSVPSAPAPVITIPASAGVATVPSPDTPPARPVIQPALRPSTGPRRSGAVPKAHAADQQKNRIDDILVAPMRSVEVLRPVEGLRAGPSGQ